MKEAFGGYWLFVIVIFFLTVFSAFLALSVNYSRAYKVKDEIIGIIERKNGIYDINGGDTGAIEEIQAYMADVGYRTQGTCSNGYVGYNLTSRGITDKPTFCVQTVDATLGSNGIPASYYKIEVFFRLEIPIFSSLFNLKLEGATKTLYYAK